MIIAIDLDGSIEENPSFFAIMSHSFIAAGHKVLILTFRDPQRAEQTIAKLAEWRVKYDEIVYAKSLEHQGELCEEYDVDLFFHDQDECIIHVPERTLVFKIRNSGNYNFDEGKWYSTPDLTQMIG